MFLWTLAFLLFLGALAAIFYYAVAAPSTQWLGRTRVRGNPSAAIIALTFDDGPGEATPHVLEILRKAGVRATFFLCGQNVERFPEHARSIVAAGHEIGNHTHSHPYLLWKTPGKIAWEIDRAQEVIASQTRYRPRLFRPPYGLRWFGLFSILHRREMTAVMWSVSGRDWRLPATGIAECILRKTNAGSIILLHDGCPPGKRGDRRQTAEALEEIVRVLSERYQFVTVSEMFSGAQQF